MYFLYKLVQTFQYYSKNYTFISASLNNQKYEENYEEDI